LLAHLNFETNQQKTRASKILLARARKYLRPINHFFVTDAQIIWGNKFDVFREASKI
jgi:hypothetical protein